MNTHSDARVRTTTQSSVAGGAAMTAVGGAVSGLSGFVLTAMVARSLGAGAAGVLAMGIAVSMICTQLAKLGADTAFVHYLPRLGSYRGGSENMHGLFARWFWAIGLIGLAGGVVLWFLAEPVAQLLLGDSEHGAVAMRMIAVGLPPAPLTAVALAAVRGLGDVRPLVLNDQIAKPLGRLLALSVVLVSGGGTDLVVLAWAAPAWVLLPWAIVALRRRTGPEHRRRRGLDPVLRREFRRYSTLRNASATVEIMGMNIGLLLVGATLGAEDAGVYSVATRLVLAGYLTLQAVRLAVAPQMSAALALDTPAEAEDLHQRTSAWIVLSAWPVYLALIVLAPEVLSAFGSEFVAGWPVLAVVALGGLVSVAAGNIQTVLLMSGRVGAYLGVAIASVAANVLVTLTIVPLIGVTGAALGFLAASVTENALALWLCRQRGVHHFGRRVLASYAAPLATIGVGCVVLRALGPDTATGLLVLVPATTFYLFVCFRWRETLALGDFIHTFRGRNRNKGAIRARSAR